MNWLKNELAIERQTYSIIIVSNKVMFVHFEFTNCSQKLVDTIREHRNNISSEQNRRIKNVECGRYTCLSTNNPPLRRWATRQVSGVVWVHVVSYTRLRIIYFCVCWWKKKNLYTLYLQLRVLLLNRSLVIRCNNELQGIYDLLTDMRMSLL